MSVCLSRQAGCVSLLLQPKGTRFFHSTPRQSHITTAFRSVMSLCPLLTSLIFAELELSWLIFTVSVQDSHNFPPLGMATTSRDAVRKEKPIGYQIGKSMRSRIDPAFENLHVKSGPVRSTRAQLLD
ncbi:hypothetical protein PHSY_005607 [Pseudozyma hubeiensis SY62]|uniref:Uncharacterized protein n=1 Tax=Pseudozyma hubeiensis (strain SY62) TaxID=1305764 RepID=R9P9J3_PSEHS|nr:hypothetical protein PHSY_005607 [Pseudozyma hubeiensis SY62]GAC98019.1 hypothetical protein PHSY_005607 [Pseudozyma hubeiensis SY62]